MIGFGPERWIEVIDAAEAARLPVLVIDSFSHAWEGVGGVLDLHSQVLDRLTRGDDSKKDQRSQLAWAEVKPRYRRLIDRIVRAKCNIIICTRAKPVMQDKTGQNARPTKTRMKNVPWDPAADGDLMFEMTAMFILDPGKPGHPVHQIKCADEFKMLFGAGEELGEQTGFAMAEWARGGGNSNAEKAEMDRARAIARGGRDKMIEFWSSDDGIRNRKVLKLIQNELGEIARRADAAAKADEADPFGLPPLDADPADQIDAETRARMLREAEEQFARNRAAEEASAG